MPYLADPVKRAQIETAVREMRPTPSKMTEAELNFTICTILNEFVHPKRRRNYRWYNAAMGVATLAPLEWWRRVTVPYETRKARENGDLPWPV